MKLNWFGNEVRFPIRSADTSGILSGQLATLAPGTGNPPHVHTREAECFMVLEGQIAMKCGANSVTLNAGDLAYLPAGLPHQLVSSASLTTKLLVLLKGGYIENAFIEASAGDLNAMKQTFAKFGVEILDEYQAAYRPVGFELVNDSHAVIRRTGDGRAVWMAGDTYTIMLSGSETDDKLALVHFDIPPGGGPLPHVHGRDFEAFVIIDGEVELYADGALATARKDDFAVLPVNIPHCFKNRTNQTSQMIAVLVPAGFERLIVEVGRTPIAGQNPPPIDDAEKKRLLQVAPRYGIKLRPEIHF